MLCVPNEDALAGTEKRLREEGVALVAVREPDPPYGGALTAIGIVPKPKKELRRHLERCRLLR